MAENSTIKFLKIRDVKDPNRSYPTDAGIDFFVPVFNESFIEDLINKNPKTFNLKEKDSKGKKFYGKNEHDNDYNYLTIQSHSSSVNYPEDKSEIPQNFFNFDIEKGIPYFILKPGRGVMIPSGIKSRMAEKGRALVAANKSGIATKHLLTFGAQVVDYTYKGEIHLHLINNSEEEVKIYQDQKIIQFLETPVFNSEIEISKKEEGDFLDLSVELATIKFYKGLKDDRGAGGFGSTDKKS